jgi:ankyrin repeat protein
MDTIHDAARKGNFEKVAALLKDKPDLVFSKDEFQNYTPLHWAASQGHKNIVELLLANKAEVNAKDSAQWTPLHKAASHGHKDVVELLLAKGADVNAQAKNGYTPLYLASKFYDALKKKDVMELLCQHGGKIGALRQKILPIAGMIVIFGGLGYFVLYLIYGVVFYDKINAKELADKANQLAEMGTTIGNMDSIVPNGLFFNQLAAKVEEKWPSHWNVEKNGDGRYTILVTDKIWDNGRTDLGNIAKEQSLGYVMCILQGSRKHLSALADVKINLSRQDDFNNTVYYEENFEWSGDTLPADASLIRNIIASGVHVTKDTASGKIMDLKIN